MRMNFVGRSVVSAITQTPASGPFAPVTTPPMSSLSMATAVCARNGAGQTNEAMPIAATVTYRLALSVIGALLVRFLFSRALLRTPSDGIVHSPCRLAIRLITARIFQLFCARRGNAKPCPRVGGARRGHCGARSAVEREPKEPSSHDEQIFVGGRGGGSAARHDRTRLFGKRNPAERARP